MTTHVRKEKKRTLGEQVSKKALTFAFFSPRVRGGDARFGAVELKE
jgi:hypothetical protein